MDSQLPRLSFWQIWNMSFGFLGIQFGFGLQLANMSAIYAKLGASPDKLPMLWLAGPMTGLLVQPIIGSMSDRTWTRLGRRRPYFLVGAILSSLALWFMPDAPIVFVAATMLWILDASINVSMEPFRAFVADKLSIDQRTTGFVMQSFFIGVGAAVANALPSIFEAWGVAGNAANGVPLTVQYSFKLGAVIFLLAVLWTVLTSPEYPPEDLAAFRRQARSGEGGFRLQPTFLLVGATGGALLGICRGALVEHHLTAWHVLAGGGIGGAIALVLSKPEVATALREMPRTMKQLAVVQFFTWLGLFCMWMFFSLATAQQIFGTTDPKSPRFDQGTAFGGQTFAIYSIVCFAVAFALPKLAAATSRKTVHSLALLCGAAGLLSTAFIHDPTALALHDDRRRHRLGVHPFAAVCHPFRRAAGGTDGRLHGHLQFLHRHPGDPRLAGAGAGGEKCVRQRSGESRHARRRLAARRGGGHAFRHRCAGGGRRQPAGRRGATRAGALRAASHPESGIVKTL